MKLVKSAYILCTCEFSLVLCMYVIEGIVVQSCNCKEISLEYLQNKSLCCRFVQSDMFKVNLISRNNCYNIPTATAYTEETISN